MKVLRGTLTFVMGMILGIVLFVLAIGGTVAIIGTQITVGKLQSSVTNQEIIAPDSELYNSTILNAVKNVIGDIKNLDTLSLKTLYEHYGIKLLNGISGIDFTDKDFYSVPIPDLINDMSIVVNSFTLNDIGKIAGVDFDSYDLPILSDNLNNKVSVAIDNVLKTINGDLSIRSIKEDFGVDIGIEDNKILSALQDVTLSEFGNVINVLRVNALLDADTDVFIVSDDAARYVATDEYEVVDLNAAEPLSPKGMYEQSLLGGIDTNGDGVADRQKTVNTHFVKKTVTENDVETEKYVVDNSSYKEDFNKEENTQTFYRRKLFRPATAADVSSGKTLYVYTYANRIETLSANGEYTLVSNGFVPTTDIDLNGNAYWAMTSERIDKDSKLAELASGQTAGKTYLRVHVGDSASILQIIAHLTVRDLQDADSFLNNLEIGDVIEITDDSAKILRSLDARHCKILEIGTAVNELSLSDMIDINATEYRENANGKYVRMTDAASYTLYDGSNPAHANAVRYSKDANGNYIVNANGAFVHNVYYTLYNPAVHGEVTRYERLPKTEETSSAILQRLAGATLGDFSKVFDSLTLADVMNVDSDVYSATDAEYILGHPDERYFYYDSESRVYRVAHDTSDGDKTYYRITQSGDSSAFLKKLAFVTVDGMADAMDVIVDDMMLSEFLDVYKENAVDLTPFENFDGADEENSRYFIEYGAGGNAYLDNDTKYVYVYDVYGDYAKANFRPVAIPDENVSRSEIYYEYVPYSSLTGSEAEKAAEIARLTAKGNLYYLASSDENSKVYERNMVLCTYMLTYPDGQYLDEVYFRKTVTGATAADVDNKTVFAGEVYTYTGSYEYGVVIRDNFRGYIPHIAGDPAFADKTLYTLERSQDGEPSFYVNKSDVAKLKDILKDHGFVSPEIYYALRQCENVYVRADNGEFVFVDGQYVPYDAEIHSAEELRFDVKQGYIGYVQEVSYLKNGARGTISEMTDIIGNATIGDIMDTEPGSLFDTPEIKSAKLSKLGDAFSDILTDMTIGDLMTWSRVTDVDERVRIALEKVTIQSLLSSLVLDDDTHEMKLDMLKLYGYKKGGNPRPVIY